ncbi:tRNA pseudouridine(38-40) synthase TruA [Gynuella sp.]|uniref:tRNA pseudouridine(38-40) synthase TruA n=1 Tax=Gynuella sp. TaxID=2969146 RepID=UPI003D099749
MEEIFSPSNPDYPIRVAMIVEYDGSGYFGWQVQKTGVITIQSVLEEAISKVANHPVDTICSGRTDSGVHACRQVIHFDTNAIRKDYGWTVGTNTKLPDDISIQWAKEMNHHFHARFSTRERRYRYVIYNYPIPHSILRNGMTWIKYPLDHEVMNQAAQSLVGTHDFSTFRAANCQAASPVRTIKGISVERYGNMLVLDVRADGFLYHMVRNIAGVLIDIGSGRQPVDWCGYLLSLCDRNRGGVTAKAAGLYFVDAIYDSMFELPETPVGPNFLTWMQDKG